MNYQIFSTQQFKIICLFFSLFLSACTGISNQKPSPFDTQLVNSMFFQLKNNSNNFGFSLPNKEISKQVITNLAEWGYIFSANLSDNDSYILKVNVGEISHGATPVGVSFSSGNSNPRSVNFQKAEILPISCSLMPKGQKLQAVELVMEVMAENYSHNLNSPKQQAQIIKELTDDISTACYNLLNHLNIKVRQTDSAVKQLKPTWIPEIRIEIENQGNNINSISNHAKPVTSATSHKTEAPRKRMIIHNQGTPIILKFGADRK
ncbi:MAG: hypothetical protein QM500_17100 [Methylococcales bacterium]